MKMKMSLIHQMEDRKSDECPDSTYDGARTTNTPGVLDRRDPCYSLYYANPDLITQEPPRYLGTDVDIDDPA